MKALILAAGLGTRLRPYTLHTPKPLFSINGQPVLDRTIEKLRLAGCREVMINTHHLHRQIEAHVARTPYSITVETRHEPKILGTGGAIANIADLWGQCSLLVINGDVVSDIDLSTVIVFHHQHQCPVTMVMHAHPEFNIVGVNDDDFVVSFAPDAVTASGTRKLAFTGIHILEPEVLHYLPARGFAGIIEAYGRMLDDRRPIKAMIVRDHYWNDIGSPERYRQAAFDHMAPLAFEKAFGHTPRATVREQAMHGDGSDRRWYRLACEGNHLIMADHGIRSGAPPQEADAFVAIGRHLHHCGIPVPRIVLSDTFCGLVFMEDLGDQHLQSVVLQCSDKDALDLYERVIDNWAFMAVEGADGFDTSWTYQTPRYDRPLILEKEARYFTEAFLQYYLNRDIAYEALADEFEVLADATMAHGVTGFMHRDFQSRNIMMHDGGIFFIDFQGGRLGPVQYDLASLLIDPYTALPFDLQRRLRRHGASILHQRYGIDEARFLKGYDCCAVTRNLQILGAFAFLSRTKGKTTFEAYIPRALECLTENLNRLSEPALPRLKALAESLIP